MIMVKHVVFLLLVGLIVEIAEKQKLYCTAFATQHRNGWFASKSITLHSNNEMMECASECALPDDEINDDLVGWSLSALRSAVVANVRNERCTIGSLLGDGSTPTILIFLRHLG
jgi:hypothetical protein